MSRTLRFTALIATLISLLLASSVIFAQEDEATPGQYDGAFTFTYPEDWELQEGTDLVRLSLDTGLLIVVGPDNYASVLGGETFDTDADELAFYMDRTGYTVGDPIETDADALAAVQVELPRRDLTGFAYLLDLEYGRKGVVVSVSEESLDTALDAATAEVLDSLTYPPNIVDIAASNDDFSTLVAAVEAAGLGETLATSELTVFAPTNAAFEAALAELGISAEDLLADTEVLTSILTYHAVEGTVLAEDVVALDGQSVDTVNGAALNIAVVDGGVVLNDTVNVTTTDIVASNGVIHVIDAVLLPPAAEEEPAEEETSEEPAEEEVVEATPLELAEATTYEGAFTFDYPSDFDVQEGTDVVTVSSPLARVLVSGPDNYALVLGNQTFESDADALAFFLDRSGYTVGEAVETNALAAVQAFLLRRDLTGVATLVDLDNGRQGVVITLNAPAVDASALNSLVIDSLVYPPDIIDVASANPDFSTLVAAVEAAGLVDTLRDTEVTVFAPSNAAFEAALAELGISAEDLLADTETLTSILTYHVVPGTQLAADVLGLDGQSVETVNGATIDIAIIDGAVTLNGTVNVVATDITASNGVIHVIDGVLLPPAAEETTEEPAEEVVVEPTVLELAESATYEGAFVFDYPSDFDLQEGTDVVTVSSPQARVLVSGPDNYATVLGNQTFESDADALAFFLDRAGYTVGEAVETDALAAVETALSRRDLTGVATLVDLDNGRQGVVITLNAPAVDASALNTLVLDSLVYPAVTCTVTANEANSVAVRVGPGNNRTPVVFLPVDVAFEVDGTNSDSGELWYRLLDKEAAAPGKLINEAWVRAANVTTAGDCEAVPAVDAPPIIPG